MSVIKNRLTIKLNEEAKPTNSSLIPDNTALITPNNGIGDTASKLKINCNDLFNGINIKIRTNKLPTPKRRAYNCKILFISAKGMRKSKYKPIINIDRKIFALAIGVKIMYKLSGKDMDVLLKISITR